MTTEIEKTRAAMADCLDRVKRAGKHRVLTAELIERVNDHLEALNDARIQFTEHRKDDLQSRLEKMTEERDQIQGRLHAIDHAYHEQSLRSGEQAKEISSLYELNRIAGDELIRAQRIARENLEDVRRAEKNSDDLHEKLEAAKRVISQDQILIAAQRLAIGELFMKGRRS